MTQASILTANGCSVRKTLDALGPLSSLLVLRDAAEGIRRFEDFVASTGRDEYVLPAIGNELASVVVALRQCVISTDRITARCEPSTEPPASP